MSPYHRGRERKNIQLLQENEKNMKKIKTISIFGSIGKAKSYRLKLHQPKIHYIVRLKTLDVSCTSFFIENLSVCAFFEKPVLLYCIISHTHTPKPFTAFIYTVRIIRFTSNVCVSVCV